MPNRIVLAGISAALLMTAPVVAQEATDVLTESLYRGTVVTGIESLADAVAAGEADAQLAAGMLQFVRSFELLSQALYRHGLVAPDTGPLGPMLTTPIPINENPEPFDYEGVRGVLEEFVASLDQASDLLLASSEGIGDEVVVIDPLRFRIDIDGDGVGGDYETLANIFATQGMIDPVPMEPTTPRPEEEPQVRDKLSSEIPTTTTDTTDETGPEGEDTTIGFDRADAIWLAGYSQILASQADFLLAHDFSGFVNALFHRLFPHAGFPMQDYAEGGMIMMDPQTDTAIADAIAGIHTLNWPVIDSERLAGVLERAKRVTDLSRQNWEAILAETDDNRELVPSPSQTALGPEGTITQEMVDAWLATLDTVDQILAGELLIPHWRFSWGFDLNAYFTTADHTDLVMLMTGYDAIPFIKDGPIADAESFAEANRVFGDSLIGYAFWFN
jgi:hypothetical protein